MLLTEIHTIKKCHNEELFELLDGFCFCAKNLRNYAQYVITQCSRISYKLKQGDILDSWEKALILKTNIAIKEYNKLHETKEKYIPLKYIDESNGFVANAYFLSWYLKSEEVYKQMPLATCSQICIQTLCYEWKSFYKGMAEYNKSPNSFLGRPKHPHYYDKETGRGWIVLTNQTIKLQDDCVTFPKVFGTLKIKTKQEQIQQVRFVTTKNAIKVLVLYKKECKGTTNNKAVMGIDIGVNNLCACAFNDKNTPVIISGRPLKSINQYYNKEKARLQAISKVLNDKHSTRKMSALVKRRNNKVKDYMHKTSRMIVNMALANGVGTIVIGLNNGWKQEVNMHKKTNQNFVGIPFDTMINMVKYKAELNGIKAVVLSEKYTSGTSYLDNELPVKANYNKSRRKKRGLFVSNCGERINADVNAAYQIMKCHDSSCVVIKHNESVKVLKVA